MASVVSEPTKSHNLWKKKGSTSIPGALSASLTSDTLKCSVDRVRICKCCILVLIDTLIN